MQMLFNFLCFSEVSVKAYDLFRVQVCHLYFLDSILQQAELNNISPLHRGRVREKGAQEHRAHGRPGQPLHLGLTKAPRRKALQLSPLHTHPSAISLSACHHAASSLFHVVLSSDVRGSERFLPSSC